MQVLFVVFAFTLLYLLQLPSLLHKDYHRDLVAFTLLMFIVFVISLLAVIGVKMPYLTVEITKVFKLILHL
jgi:hypothetical protein